MQTSKRIFFNVFLGASMMVGLLSLFDALGLRSNANTKQGDTPRHYSEFCGVHAKMTGLKENSSQHPCHMHYRDEDTRETGD